MKDYNYSCTLAHASPWLFTIPIPNYSKLKKIKYILGNNYRLLDIYIYIYNYILE